MKLTLAWAAAALATATAHGAQPQIAEPANSASPESAKSARSAPPFGRLFFTPAERAQLDTARIHKKTVQAVPPQEPAASPPPIVTYGGIVRRSDGKAMLWINNQLVDEKEALSALNVKGKVRSDGAVTIQVPDSRASVDVKVGQSVDLQSGKIAETWRFAPQPKQPGREEDRADAAPASATRPDPASRRPEPPADQRVTATK